MPDQPLQPFSLPTSLAALLPDGVSAGVAIEWFLYVVFAFWVVYTIVAVYHWLQYSHASWAAFPAIAAHLLISLALIGYALSGNASFLSQYLP
ncbi:TPA: hypothetical protein DIV48_01920 [Candidatus Kaiserbacteria bacterium]|nr:MAG: hypothetical protein UY93_C0002G0134 [Parcubacteria group bacterium GW2011_GWA1_56_13]HCR52389.1 hypothetical protein [Candidatus Kaiserbacteria bacterium]